MFNDILNSLFSCLMIRIIYFCISKLNHVNVSSFYMNPLFMIHGFSLFFFSNFVENTYQYLGDMNFINDK